MIKQILVAITMWLTIAAIFPMHGQHKQNTLGNLWPKVEESYPGVGARESAIDAATLNERVVKSDMLPQVKAQAQNTYGTYEGSAGAFYPQAGFLAPQQPIVSDRPPSNGSCFHSEGFVRKEMRPVPYQIKRFAKRMPTFSALKTNYHSATLTFCIGRLN